MKAKQKLELVEYTSDINSDAEKSFQDKGGGMVIVLASNVYQIRNMIISSMAYSFWKN